MAAVDSINNPLINESAEETVLNVSNVLTFLMGSIPGAEIGEYFIDQKPTTSPKNGLSIILECCVLALAHSVKAKG